MNSTDIESKVSAADENIKQEVSVGTEKVNVDNADLALEALHALGTFEYTPEEERAVVWKIDMRLMPIMALTFGTWNAWRLCYLSCMTPLAWTV